MIAVKCFQTMSREATGAAAGPECHFSGDGRVGQLRLLVETAWGRSWTLGGTLSINAIEASEQLGTRKLTETYQTHWASIRNQKTMIYHGQDTTPSDKTLISKSQPAIPPL